MKRGGRAIGWTGRLGGAVLCAFFGLGYFTGLHAARNALAARAISTVDKYKSRIREEAALVREWPSIWRHRPIENAGPQGVVAMVERRDGFYSLLSSGEMRGPVSAGAEANLPIISGETVVAAPSKDLVEYASMLVRAEAVLSELISEMRLGPDGEASLFFDGSRTEVVIDLDDAPIELDRAATVLRRWRGREAQVAALDMTTPGQAILRLRPASPSHRRRMSNPAPRSIRRAGPERPTIAMRNRMAGVEEAGLE